MFRALAGIVLAATLAASWEAGAQSSLFRRLTVTLAGTGSGTVTSNDGAISCPGDCIQDYVGITPAQSVTLSAIPAPGSTFAGWSQSCSGTAPCTLSMSSGRAVTATFNQLPADAAPSPAALAFGGQSVQTSSRPKSIRIANPGGGPTTITSITVPAGFHVTHSCTVIGGGGECHASVTFRPTGVISYSGVLSISHTAGAARTVALSGLGEASLVTHYYSAILRREADAGGKAYWEAQAERVRSLGGNVNEVWFALAMEFFSSPEYRAFNRDNAGFTTDLYQTFFSREPDAGGLAYWAGQLDAGLPREVLVAYFMFSPEFRAFAQGIFGNTEVRREIDTVMDFYRGLLSRLPDDGGFGYWLASFRAAQCQGPAAVHATAEFISGSFLNGPEYAARARTNAQFVGDLYNAFMRRGGELSGVQYWIGELASGRRTREDVRRAFVTSPEFSSRVQQVIGAQCAPTPVIHSLSRSSSRPMSPITIATSGMDPALPVEIRFSDSAGVLAKGPPIRRGADGTIVVGVPLLFSRSGQLTSGEVLLTVVQQGVASAPAALHIGPLPTVAQYGVAPGRISRDLLAFQAQLIADRINQIQIYEIGSTSPRNMAATKARLMTVLRTTLEARRQVESFMANPSQVIDLGSVDGKPAVLDASTIDMMDRIGGVFLENAFTSSLPGAAAGYEPRRLAKATAPPPPPAALTGTLGILGTTLSGSSAASSLWNLRGTCPQLPGSQKCLNDIIGAIAASGGYAASLLGETPFGLRLGFASALTGVVGLGQQLYASRTLSESEPGVEPPDLLSSYDTLLSSFFAYESMAAVAGGPSALAAVGARAAAVTPFGAVVGLTLKVYTDFKDQVEKADAQVMTDLAIAAWRRERQRAGGKMADDAGNQPLVELCSLGSASLCLVQVPDLNGNYSFSVPLGAPNTSYGSLTLRATSTVTGGPISTQSVNLSNLVFQPVLIPPDCYGALQRCFATCTGDLIQQNQCVNRCNSAYLNCL